MERLMPQMKRLRRPHGWLKLMILLWLFQNGMTRSLANDDRNYQAVRDIEFLSQEPYSRIRRSSYWTRRLQLYITRRKRRSRIPFLKLQRTEPRLLSPIVSPQSATL